MKTICGKRFSDSAIKRAERIANDVSEGIYNGDTETQLRAAVAYWSCVAAEEAQSRAALEGEKVIAATVKAMRGCR